MLSAPLPNEGPIGEAWILSDRDDHQSRVANGSLKGRTLRQMLELAPEQMLGAQAARFARFPLLLKFLDAKEMLSVQVHPSDAQPQLLPARESGKSEAWVVLKAGPESRIYAGLKAGTNADDLRRAVENGTLLDSLSSFTPKPGDAVFVPAGTVHTLGREVVVFEVQQNSDVTFRLYDWNRLDTKTGQLRALQVEQALACVDVANHAAGLTSAVAESTPGRERLLECAEFSVWRVRQDSLFRAGASGVARVLVCLDGMAHLEHDDAAYILRTGDVWLLPAAIGICDVRPDPTVELLEVALPG
jgi:mannose-6-phosphate isomerase